MAKIFRRTAYFPAVEDGRTVLNVTGCFIEEQALDIWQSKQNGRETFKRRVVLNVVVQTGGIKDMVSHEIFDKDEKSDILKKKFSAAWQDYINNPDKIVIEGANEAADETRKQLDVAQGNLETAKQEKQLLGKVLGKLLVELDSLRANGKQGAQAQEITPAEMDAINAALKEAHDAQQAAEPQQYVTTPPASEAPQSTADELKQKTKTKR
jgi:hypothetical protein